MHRVVTIIVSAGLALVSVGARAGNYVVAPPPTGSDSGDGTAAHPWATLQHAADTVQPGDSVDVKAGSYTGFDLTTSGTANAEISFIAESGVTIDADNGTTPDGINLEGVSYATIQGFTVDNRTRTGIRTVTGSHVTIRGNHVDHSGSWGILTGFVDDLLIEDNVCSNSVAQHGIYVGNSGDRPVVRGNTLYGNTANGLHMNGDLSQGGDGIISNALVEDNIIYDNGTAGGSGINCDGVQDSVIQNNLLFGNHASGVSLYQTDGGGPSTGDTVVNNTILLASDARWALNVQNGATGGTYVNNILLNTSSHGAISISTDSLTGTTSDYNVVTPIFTTDGGDSTLAFAAWQKLGYDAHSISSTPTAVFVDATATDATGYELAAGSPAIDKGTATGAPSTDLVGTSRPQGAGFDIGALEQCSGACAQPPGGGDGSPPDAAPGGSLGGDAGPATGAVTSGCCDASSSSHGPIALATLVALAMLRPRRRARG